MLSLKIYCQLAKQAVLCNNDSIIQISVLPTLAALAACSLGYGLGKLSDSWKSRKQYFQYTCTKLQITFNLLYKTDLSPQKHAWNAPFPVTFAPKMKAIMYSCFYVMEAKKHTCSTKNTIGT